MCMLLMSLSRTRLIVRRFAVLGGVALLLMSVAMFAMPSRVAAKSYADPTVTLSPTSGLAKTHVTMQGKNFAPFCIGTLRIDDAISGTTYNCNEDGTFTLHFDWPDGLTDGQHVVGAQGLLGQTATTTFTQIAPTPTPDAGATATAGAVATVAAQSTASAVATTAAQATATTTSQATATASAAQSGGQHGTTTRPGDQGVANSGPSSILLGLLLIMALLLLASGVVITLMMNNRRRAATFPMGGRPYIVSTRPPTPPPPPRNQPSDATLPQDDTTPTHGETWIWPNDPTRR